MELSEIMSALQTKITEHDHKMALMQDAASRTGIGVAISLLNAGNVATRKSWGGTMKVEGMAFNVPTIGRQMAMILKSATGQIISPNWTPSVSDNFADDWVQFT